MDAIDYINLVTSNTFSDWLRCHNNILYDDTIPVDNSDDTIKIISHISKTLSNEKIPSINKYYLMVSIEEHLTFFIKSESGAIYLDQLLLTDFKNRLNLKWDSMYMCQLLTLICSISVQYNLSLSNIHQSQSLTEGIITQLMEIVSTENSSANWLCLKHLALCSLLHLETCYPTILLKMKSKLTDLIQKEKSIFYELLLQIYSLVYKNEMVDKCRQQHEDARLKSVERVSPTNEIYNKAEIVKLFSWLSSTGKAKEKLICSQSHIFKSLLNLIQDAALHLTPLGINNVAHNCLGIASYLSQDNPLLWSGFITRFIRSSDICILEIFMSLKISSRNGAFIRSLLPDESLQETLFAVMNNSINSLYKRLMAAHWLIIYPFSKQITSGTGEHNTSDNYSSLLEPELVRNIFLRSFDGIELKYCKLMLMSLVIKTTTQSDCNSVLLFSSLTELIKNINYYEPGLYSNILIRVMFAMHTRHYDSILICDFESIFDNLVIKYPTILPSVVTYLNAISALNLDNNISCFSARCLSQIVKLSNEKLAFTLTELDKDTVKMHLQVLNCAVNMSELNLQNYLEVLIELITACKFDLDIRWLEEACFWILELCFNIIKRFGSSSYYKELAVVLNEIRGELLDPIMGIRAHFLYALIVSLSSKKVRKILSNKQFSDINENDFEIIYSTLLDNHCDESSLMLVRNSKSYTVEKSRYRYDGNLSGYFDFINDRVFPILFLTKLQPKDSSFCTDFLYGVEVEFKINLSGATVKPWTVEFIQSFEKNTVLIEDKLQIILSKIDSLTINGKLSATKLNGVFTFYSIATECVELFELGLQAPLDLIDESTKLVFLEDLISNKLLNCTFTSIDFKSSENYNRFKERMQDYLFSETANLEIYLMFLPPRHHIVFKQSVLSIHCCRFDIFSDLDLGDLISIEEFLQRFE